MNPTLSGAACPEPVEGSGVALQVPQGDPEQGRRVERAPRTCLSSPPRQRRGTFPTAFPLPRRERARVRVIFPCAGCHAFACESMPPFLTTAEASAVPECIDKPRFPLLSFRPTHRDLMLPPLPGWERERVRVKKALAELAPSGPCSPLDPFGGTHPLQQTQVTPRAADRRAKLARLWRGGFRDALDPPTDERV